jgi:hypothetical protein
MLLYIINIRYVHFRDSIATNDVRPNAMAGLAHRADFGKRDTRHLYASHMERIFFG